MMPTLSRCLALWAALTCAHAVSAGEVAGRVEMPPACAPEVSPAVVRLEPLDALKPASTPALRKADALVLVNQRGLRFEPRVVVLKPGQALRFGNEDQERHNIHVLSTGASFNETIPPGKTAEFRPGRPGVVRVVCDVHSHMRAYAVVGGSPWIAKVGRAGTFRFAEVPAGRYKLIAWHEMGEPIEREITVGDGPIDAGTLTLKSSLVIAAGAQAPIEPWSDVTDHIGVTLSASLDAAKRPGGKARAVRLAQDAYFGQFEASDMETAVRAYLGLTRSAEIESQFREIVAAIRNVADKKAAPATVTAKMRALFVSLAKADAELKARGITDRSKVLPSAVAAVPATGAASGDATQELAALAKAFAGVRTLADAGQGEAASLAMGDAYFDAFEPLETRIKLHDAGAVRRLEIRFNTLRGAVGSGLKGEPLGRDLAALEAETATALRGVTPGTQSDFALAFGASFGTILREGVEVILLLTMLVALVAKTGQPGAMRSLRRGVVLGLVASGLTAFALNLLVASSRGRTREVLEGAVLLLAAGVLFYVSYWLISQSESKRWMEFLKRQMRHGAEAGGYFALGLTAFLAVYREGAETALMYQALLSGQSRSGMLGVGIGLATGLVVLGWVYVVIRAGSRRLPLRAFFQVTGCILFAMAVVFAGHGVAELQTSRVLKWTALPWMGDGLPLLGIYPNMQCLAIQGILVAGALAALVVMFTGGRREVPAPKSVVNGPRPTPPAGVAV